MGKWNKNTSLGIDGIVIVDATTAVKLFPNSEPIQLAPILCIYIYMCELYNMLISVKLLNII